MTAPEQQEGLRRPLSNDEITAELAPLAAVITRVLRITPVRIGDTSDLTAALTLAVAAYMGPLVGDMPRQLAVLREQAERYQLGALERAALLEEARDALEAAGVNGAHGDDWPAITPAIRALAAERDRLRALLARDHAAAYHQGEPRDGLLWHCGRDHCTAPGDQPPAVSLLADPGNAEDCPSCRERRDLPYPFLCPGHPTA